MHEHQKLFDSIPQLFLIQFDNLRSLKINEISVKRIHKNLIVGILGIPGKSKEVPLTHVVLQSEIRKVLHKVIFKHRGVLLGKLHLRYGDVIRTLGRLHKISNHQGALGEVGSHPASELVLVDKGQLSASGVEQDLVDHHVSLGRILVHGQQHDHQSDDHPRKHGWVGLVKRVLLDQVSQYPQSQDVLRIQQTQSVPSRSMVVQQKEAIVKLEQFLEFRTVQMFSFSYLISLRLFFGLRNLCVCLTIITILGGKEPSAGTHLCLLSEHRGLVLQFINGHYPRI